MRLRPLDALTIKATLLLCFGLTLGLWLNPTAEAVSG